MKESLVERNPGCRTVGSNIPARKAPGCKTLGSKTPICKTHGRKTPKRNAPEFKNLGCKTPERKTDGRRPPECKTPGRKTPRLQKQNQHGTVLVYSITDSALIEWLGYSIHSLQGMS